MITYCVEVDNLGTIRWYQPGLGRLHRLDGPAVERHDGDREWWQNGLLHRIDGPAIELTSGTKKWFSNDFLHRIDGPAIEWCDGSLEYHYQGVHYSEKQFCELMNDIRQAKEEIQRARSSLEM